jgi:hypothetical protein
MTQRACSQTHLPTPKDRRDDEIIGDAHAHQLAASNVLTALLVRILPGRKLSSLSTKHAGFSKLNALYDLLLLMLLRGNST